MAKKPAKRQVAPIQRNPVLLSLEILTCTDCQEQLTGDEYSVVWGCLIAIREAAGPDRWDSRLFHVLVGDDPAPDWLKKVPEWDVLNDLLNLVYGRAHP